MGSLENSIESGLSIQTPQGCHCGVNTIGGGIHSDYCPLSS